MIDVVDLVERLSSDRIRADLDRLFNLSDGLGDQSHDSQMERLGVHACRCGCGRGAVAPRQFVNQTHQTVWLQAQEGRNFRRSKQ